MWKNSDIGDMIELVKEELDKLTGDYLTIVLPKKEKIASFTKGCWDKITKIIQTQLKERISKYIDNTFLKRGRITFWHRF